MLASCSGDKTVRIWRSRSGAQPAPDGGASAAAAAACAPSTSGDWHCQAVLEEAHGKTVRAICWAPDGRHLASASFDATVAVWRLQGGVWELVATLEGHENEVKAVAWNPNGSLIATCGRDRHVWIWESLPGNEYETVDVKAGAHSQDVKSVCWHPGGELLASCSYDDTIKLWAQEPDGDGWACVQTLGGDSGLLGHTSTVWAVAWSPDGSSLASVSADCTVRLWHGARAAGGSGVTWRRGAVIQGHHARPIYSVDWSPAAPLADGEDGSEAATDLLATGDGSNGIKIFAPTLPGGRDGAAQVAEQGLAAAGGALASWALAGSREQAHSADVNCVRWHPTQPGLLASAGDDNLVKLWHVERRPP